MLLKQQTTIHAEPHAVWGYLCDPVLQALWNPKVVSIDRDADGPVYEGERFEMMYRMSSQEQLSRVRVAVFRPDEQLVFEHTTEIGQNTLVVTEAYDLKDVSSGTHLRQTIDMPTTGIPWPFRIVIWLVTRLGKDVQEPTLDTLKRIIEEDTAV